MSVVNFLNVTGVERAYIDEDAIMQFASLVREFRRAMQQTHDDAMAAHGLA